MSTPTFKQLLASMKKQRNQSTVDKELVKLFQDHEERLSKLFDESLPQNNDWAKYTGPVIDFFGPAFHRAFRQQDILNVDDDVFVHKALGQDASVFWKAAKAVLIGNHKR